MSFRNLSGMLSGRTASVPMASKVNGWLTIFSRCDFFPAAANATLSQELAVVYWYSPLSSSLSLSLSPSLPLSLLPSLTSHSPLAGGIQLGCEFCRKCVMIFVFGVYFMTL